MSIKSISSAFHLSRNTVRKYVRRYQESGLTLDQLMTMSEEKLQELFLDNQNRSRKPSPRMDELEALIPDYVKRLSRKGVTVKSLHDEYLREHPDGYKYSTFKRAVRRQKYHVRVVGHVDHLAGDQMYIDYAGDKLEIVDAETGEVRFVEVFVAILPGSSSSFQWRSFAPSGVMRLSPATLTDDHSLFPLSRLTLTSRCAFGTVIVRNLWQLNSLPPLPTLFCTKNAAASRHPHAGTASPQEYP